MTKTLAQLKRDAKSGNYSAEIVYRFGDEIPEWLRGVRKMVGANSVAIFFMNNDGEKSELQIRRAALIDYTDDALTVYGSGVRPLTENEKKTLADWEVIKKEKENEEQMLIDCLTDGNVMYWKEKRFFEDRGMSHLFGGDCGAEPVYDGNEICGIRDINVRGDKEIEYRIIREA